MEVVQIFKGGNKCNLFCNMICKFGNHISYNKYIYVCIKQIFYACIKYIGTCIPVYMKQIHCFGDVKLVNTCDLLALFDLLH